MGYTTDFKGFFEFDRTVDPSLVNYINKLSATRRMKRDNDKIKKIFPNWKDFSFNGRLGEEGGFFIGGAGFAGQDHDDSIIDFNQPPKFQPSLWCDWIIKDNKLIWNETEKFYGYTDWLTYLIYNFFNPCNYLLNGEVNWQGEDSLDKGIIKIIDNKITIKNGH